MAEASYYRVWRAAHPEYRQRQNELRRARRQEKGRGDRSKEYARRPSRVQPKPEPLFPHIRHGTKVAFWDEELHMDLAQERELALLEGRDPDEAVATYRARETTWAAHTRPLEP